MAEEAGHTVMQSPLHDSDFQPIELVWSNVKVTVGRKYTTTITLADVSSRLNSDFAILDTNILAGCVK